MCDICYNDIASSEGYHFTNVTDTYCNACGCQLNGNGIYSHKYGYYCGGICFDYRNNKRLSDLDAPNRKRQRII